MVVLDGDTTGGNYCLFFHYQGNYYLSTMNDSNTFSRRLLICPVSNSSQVTSSNDDAVSCDEAVSCVRDLQFSGAAERGPTEEKIKTNRCESSDKEIIVSFIHDLERH